MSENPLQPLPAQNDLILPLPTTPVQAGKIKAVEDALALLNKGQKRPIVGTVKQVYGNQIDADFITTGIMTIDAVLGGGFAKQRMYEVYGPEGSGKTTLALQVMANAQRRGGLAVMIDAEHAFDTLRATTIGVDIDKLYLSQPDYGEQAIDIAVSMCKTEAVDVLVIDSVAALIPKAEYEGTMEDSQQMALAAVMMSKAMRMLKGACRHGNTCVIFINQLREKPGVVYGNPEYTPGGRAVKFFSDVRVEIRKQAAIKVGDSVIGQNVRVQAVKNKLAPPMVPALAKLFYDSRGFDELASVIETATMQGVLQKAGNWIAVPLGSDDFPDMGGRNIGQGVEQARQFIFENEPFRKKLIEVCTSNILDRRRQVIEHLSHSVRVGEITPDQHEAPPESTKRVPAAKKKRDA